MRGARTYIQRSLELLYLSGTHGAMTPITRYDEQKNDVEGQVQSGSNNDMDEEKGGGDDVDVEGSSHAETGGEFSDDEGDIAAVPITTLPHP
jgi:hypothetical protein